MLSGQHWLFPGYRGSIRVRVSSTGSFAWQQGVPALPNASAFTHCGTALATHLLEQKTDIRIIQVLLGHKKLDTTALYTRVAVSALGQVTSPLDFLLKMPALTRGRCHGQRSRWRTSSATADRLGVRPMPVM